MKLLGLNEIREKYLQFFVGRDHLRLPSAPLVPQGDSSLLLINSGMAPLKPYFSGEVKPPHPRATSCQKCVRVVDIENVGRTSRHCTFFEMLGHFSFGDYFKKEAITWTWEFFTRVMGLDPSLLYCSVYLDDDEAWDIWTKDIGIDPSHMVRLGKEDNFWDVGSGPCGPCSEIYFDRGAENGCGQPGCKPGCDCDRFVEVGNNVFTQFNNDGAGNYTPLEQKNIDFGMGLERLACVVQGVDNVFEVDTIRRIREHVSRLAAVEYGRDEKKDVSIRVVTDHIRSTAMLVCDGVLPGNEGRGYVLRRLLRRAARHGKLLGIDRPFLFELCGTVIDESKAAYPELEEKRAYITRVIALEEDRFALTINQGLQLLREDMEALRAAGGRVLSGESAFRLYDTFGFPIDLTREILEESALELDAGAFDGLMSAQRERARAARRAMGDMAWERVDLGLDRELTTAFIGYETLVGEASVWALLSEGEICEMVSEGQQAVVVLDRTPFYAESGGQSADCGIIAGKAGVFEVSDVQKTKDGKYTHAGVMRSGSLSVGEAVKAEVDKSRRAAVMRAHSATHLLQKALREVLGDQVEQRGSFVAPDTLRFDFTHFAAMTAEEIGDVARRVNDAILDDLPVSIREMPVAEARALGAMALFGEKYGDVVRVVEMGEYSLELCGGTHVRNTARIGCLQIISESSVAAGVRRIEAHVGKAVLARAEEFRSMVYRAADMLKTSPQDLAQRLEKLVDEQRGTLRELQKLRVSGFWRETEDMMVSAQKIGGLRVFTARRDDVDLESMRAAGDRLRDKNPDGVGVLASVTEGKILLFAVCGAEAVARGVKAGDLIKTIAPLCGGSGGGRPDSATGGGRDAEKIGDALAAVEGFIRGKVNA